MLKNPLAAEIALVSDELEAELIRTKHILDVLYCDTDAVIRSLQGASFPHHKSKPRVYLCLPRDDAFTESN